MKNRLLVREVCFWNSEFGIKFVCCKISAEISLYFLFDLWYDGGVLKGEQQRTRDYKRRFLPSA